MSHPHNEHRDHKKQHSRVHHITKAYATGGGVHADEMADKKLIKRTVKKSALKMHGEKPKHRADHRARGGRTKSKGKTNVNVIVAPQQHGMPSAMGGPGMGAPPVAPAMPPRPPMAPPMPPQAGAMPPGAPPPGMPIRASGGRISDGPTWKEGIRNGTQPQNSPGKNDGKDIGRGRVVTFRTGGRIEASNKVEAASKLPGGSGGGEARLSKEQRAKRNYA